MQILFLPHLPRKLMSIIYEASSPLPAPFFFLTSARPTGSTRRIGSSYYVELDEVPSFKHAIPIMRCGKLQEKDSSLKRSVGHYVPVYP